VQIMQCTVKMVCYIAGTRFYNLLADGTTLSYPRSPLGYIDFLVRTQVTFTLVKVNAHPIMLN
jgi:hypothetical protein